VLIKIDERVGEGKEGGRERDTCEIIRLIFKFKIQQSYIIHPKNAIPKITGRERER
jgi:hypothetical protein